MAETAVVPTAQKKVRKDQKPKIPKTGGTVRDVKPAKFIAAYAAFLKRKAWLKLPSWVDLVKTGSGRQMCPLDRDWYFIRAASIARKLYLFGGKRGVGVGRLRKYYGTSKHMGPRPNHFVKASGAVVAHILKQLTLAGVLEPHSDGGRKITREGTKDLDRIACKCIMGKAPTLKRKLAIPVKKVPKIVAEEVVEKTTEPKTAAKGKGGKKPEGKSDTPVAKAEVKKGGKPTTGDKPAGEKPASTGEKPAAKKREAKPATEKPASTGEKPVAKKGKGKSAEKPAEGEGK